MRRITPRAISLNILNQLEGANRHPDRLLSDSFKRYRHLTSLDRAFLTELTYGTLRWRGKLDWVIRQFSTVPFDQIEPGILNILRLGLYQILFLSRTPVSAAVNESVELSKGIRRRGGAGFVNAVLRSILRQRESISFPGIDQDPVSHIAVVHSHPVWLIQSWMNKFGVEETLRICTINNRIPHLVLRTNTLKINREALIAGLREKGLEPSPTVYSEEGILLKDAPPVSELPFLREGLCVIQDEASQLVTQILEPKPGERILDACAAPGGKTTHMAQRMMDQGVIYALDVTIEKLRGIGEACQRLGIKSVKTLKGDTARSLPIPEGLEFDRVLADVPCSGFGTLRRNPDIKWRKGEKDIHRLAELQSSILENVSRYVKKGGILVYSTCTVFHEENEDVVGKFLSEHPEFRLDPINDILPERCHRFIRNGYFRTFPPVDEMDGFFVARMKKMGEIA